MPWTLCWAWGIQAQSKGGPPSAVDLLSPRSREGSRLRTFRINRNEQEPRISGQSQNPPLPRKAFSFSLDYKELPGPAAKGSGLEGGTGRSPRGAVAAAATSCPVPGFPLTESCHLRGGLSPVSGAARTALVQLWRDGGGLPPRWYQSVLTPRLLPHLWPVQTDSGCG